MAQRIIEQHRDLAGGGSDGLGLSCTCCKTSIEGKQILGKTSKMGQRDIRRLLIIGAMSMVRWAVRKGAPEGSSLARMLARKPRMVVYTIGSSTMASAVVERFFKTLKAELILRNKWETRRQAEIALFEYINGFYNPRSRHSALGGKSLLGFERQTA